MEIIFGAVVSAFTEFLKRNLGTNVLGTYLIVIALSMTAATLYVALVAGGYWETVVKILIVSGAVYSFVIKRLES